MDYIAKFKRQLLQRIIVALLLPFGVMATVWVFINSIVGLDPIATTYISFLSGLCMIVIVVYVLVAAASGPVELLQQIISYASNTNRQASAPVIEHAKLGRELISALARQVYELASDSDELASQDGSSILIKGAPTGVSIGRDSTQAGMQVAQLIIDELATPIIGLNKQQIVVVANKAAHSFFSANESMSGRSFYDVTSLSFKDENSLENWIKDVSETNVTASMSWERVRHIENDDTTKQFDLTAGFSSESSTGIEVMLAFFDKTDRYAVDDTDLSLVAMAVHELRTPLTVMRGYIEVFQDELAPTLDAEMLDFMHKMQASAEQLAAFVGNILNVARVEENQLTLKLRSEDWKTILENALEDLELRARVRNQTIVIDIASNLPPIAADRISLHEVINNLIDNAIKYSPEGSTINVRSYLNDQGLVETAIEDHGIGIPQAVVGDLFQKFHRSHKSRTQVGGTGLGLYLCKALVNAHGGHISVRTQEGKGSTFSFTLLPYDKISAEQKAGEDGIIRGAHGWIKNHSMYRS